MKTQAALRICVALEWVAVIIFIGLTFALEDNLPAPLKDWLAAEADRDLAAHEVVVLGGLFVFLLTMVVASVGLLLLQRWAAWLYLYSVAFGFLTSLATGPVVEHAVADVVDELSILFAGLILGLAFFTDALRPGEVRAELVPEASGGRVT